MKDYTPGNWRAEEEFVMVYVPKGSSKALANCWQSDINGPIGNEKENYANARLMAAAPDLLEACKLQQALIEDMSRFLGNMGLKDYGLLNEATLKAPLAIKKAEGAKQ